ncbi:hypothetical protein JXJ21_04010 [candidate division KSB1 bacterium]|nr:hypothetical protein [candidate division KSB1 bacterium]
MGFFRLILWAIIIYFIYLFYRHVFKKLPPRDQTKVSGKPEKDSLNLSDYDVEDAKFEDLDED